MVSYIIPTFASFITCHSLLPSAFKIPSSKPANYPTVSTMRRNEGMYGRKEMLSLTSIRPIVPQLPSSQNVEFDMIQKKLPSPQFATSEKHGLNLVVTVPPGATTNSKLPVFV